MSIYVESAKQTSTEVDLEKADLVVVGVTNDTLSRVCIPVSILHEHKASVMALAAYVQHLNKILSTLSIAQQSTIWHSLVQHGLAWHSTAQDGTAWLSTM